MYTERTLNGPLARTNGATPAGCVCARQVVLILSRVPSLSQEETATVEINIIDTLRAAVNFLDRESSTR